MKVGDRVMYRAADGRVAEAVVSAVVGAGGSGYKMLDLSVGADTFKGVLHIGDVGLSGACWALGLVFIEEEEDIWYDDDEDGSDYVSA